MAVRPAICVTVPEMRTPRPCKARGQITHRNGDDVGIFSLFGKKDREQPDPADKDSARAKRDTSGRKNEGGGSKKDSRETQHNADTRNSAAKPSPKARTSAVKRDAQAALATAMKIDAIESEMSSEFVAPTTGAHFGNTIPMTPAGKSVPPQLHAKAPAPAAAEPASKKSGKNTLTDMGTTTQFLLGGMTTLDATPASNITPVVEEAAIMYANGQNHVVEQMLRAAIEEDKLGDMTQTVWLMLLDLYQVTGKQQEFDSQAIAYAGKFETSPPAWTRSVQDKAPPAAPSSGSTPIVPFTGKLDAGVVKQIERIQKLSENYRTLRLEFARVAEVDTQGCGLLLGQFRTLHKSGHDLILVGALELTEKIRGILEVGRRDDGEDAWLLLLELLRLLNREKEFEEASIDYCVTFEVSPPAFVAPKNKVTTAATEATAPAVAADCFMMPAVIEGRIDNLIVAILAWSDEHNPAIVDCSQLTRVDFNAAGRLLTGLSPFSGNGRSIEFHHVNHLVTALFGVIGLKDLVRVIPRKN
jgi:ABC-type transporter Mla MlaB component